MKKRNATPRPDDLDFDDTPKGWASRWAVEIENADKELKTFKSQAEEANKAYLGEAGEGGDTLPLNHADVETMRCALYGRMPSVDAERRFSDPDDDDGRVAAEIYKRLLNTDIESDAEGSASSLKDSLKDWLTTSLGQARVRYECEWETVPAVPAQVDPLTGQELAPEVPEQEQKKPGCEFAPLDHVHWDEFRWSPCRKWSEVTWVSFENNLLEFEFVRKFGRDAWKLAPKMAGKTDSDDDKKKKVTPWSTVQVQEIWHKDSKQVFFWVKGVSEVLVPIGIGTNPSGGVPDPLGLKGFWPCPAPLAKNVGSKKFIPKPDYTLAKKLYGQCERLNQRIGLLEDALRVVGIHDAAHPALGQLLEGGDRQMIPVANFAMLKEKGGLKGAVDWFPLDMIVAALDKLTEKLAQKMGLLQQITGEADIMRGQGDPNATATQESIKAQFGSVRIKDAQDEFARFASDLQKLKAEVIANHFEPETIAERSNIMRTKDAPRAQAAIALVKDKHAEFRISVKPENISTTDYATQRQERGESIASIGGLLQQAMPLIQMGGPQAMKAVLELAQWTLAGVRGSGPAERTLDDFIAATEQAAQQAAMQPPQPPPPDPKVIATQMKVQGDLQASQLDAQNRQQEIQAETQSSVAVEAVKHHFNMQSAEAKARAAGLQAVTDVVGPQGAT